MRDHEGTFDPLESLSVREVAALLHVSRPTVEKYIKLCKLPSVLIGRCRRIRRIDLADFLERRTACTRQARLSNETMTRPANTVHHDVEEVPF